jgi:hypothetical protein
MSHYFMSNEMDIFVKIFAGQEILADVREKFRAFYVAEF